MAKQTIPEMEDIENKPVIRFESRLNMVATFQCAAKAATNFSDVMALAIARGMIDYLGDRIEYEDEDNS